MYSKLTVIGVEGYLHPDCEQNEGKSGDRDNKASVRVKVHNLFFFVPVNMLLMSGYNKDTYGCGHTVTENPFGKVTDRQRILEAAKNKFCKDCYKAEQAVKAV